MQEIADFVQCHMVRNRQRFVRPYFPDVLALVEELHADRQLAPGRVFLHFVLHGFQKRVQRMGRANIQIEIPLVDRLDLHRNAVLFRLRKPRAKPGHAFQHIPYTPEKTFSAGPVI